MGKAIEVRSESELELVDRLIIPGGESTTVGKLLFKLGLGEKIRERVQNGMPIWGTCMGMILMAKEVENYDQYTLNLLDISVRRNAFGAQVHSFEAQVSINVLPEPVLGVFIRAPIVTKFGDDVEVLSRFHNQIVAVKQGSIVATSFHPELTDSIEVHKWFLGLK